MGTRTSGSPVARFSAATDFMVPKKRENILQLHQTHHPQHHHHHHRRLKLPRYLLIMIHCLTYIERKERCIRIRSSGMLVCMLPSLGRPLNRYRCPSMVLEIKAKKKEYPCPDRCTTTLQLNYSCRSERWRREFYPRNTSTSVMVCSLLSPYC